MPASFHRKSNVLGKYKIPKRPEDELPEGSHASAPPKTGDSTLPPQTPNVFTTNLREQFTNASKAVLGPTVPASLAGRGVSGADGAVPPLSTPKTNIFQRFHNNKEDPSMPMRGTPTPSTSGSSLSTPSRPTPTKPDTPKTNNFWSMMRPNETVVVKAADSGVAVTEASSSSSLASVRGKNSGRSY